MQVPQPCVRSGGILYTAFLHDVYTIHAMSGIYKALFGAPARLSHLLVFSKIPAAACLDVAMIPFLCMVMTARIIRDVMMGCDVSGGEGEVASVGPPILLMLHLGVTAGSRPGGLRRLHAPSGTLQNFTRVGQMLCECVERL